MLTLADVSAEIHRNLFQLIKIKNKSLKVPKYHVSTNGKQLLILVFFQFRKRKQLQLEGKEPRGDFAREVFMYLVLYPITNITDSLPELQGE